VQCASKLLHGWVPVLHTRVDMDDVRQVMNCTRSSDGEVSHSQNMSAKGGVPFDVNIAGLTSGHSSDARRGVPATGLLADGLQPPGLQPPARMIFKMKLVVPDAHQPG
jgi:hypothetical protein